MKRSGFFPPPFASPASSIALRLSPEPARHGSNPEWGPHARRADAITGTTAAAFTARLYTLTYSLADTSQE